MGREPQTRRKRRYRAEGGTEWGGGGVEVCPLQMGPLSLPQGVPRPHPRSPCTPPPDPAGWLSADLTCP